MKKIYILIILLAGNYLARSQNLITACEYWTDNNYSARITPALTPSSVFNFNSVIDFTGLSNGVHLFNVRFMQSDGSWSSTVNQLFVKTPVGTGSENSITAYEYWLDNAYSARVSQAVSPAAVYTFTSDIDFSGLSNGVHLFNIRFRQSDGSWSSTVNQLFVKSPVGTGSENSITAYEYWLDNAYSGKVREAVAPTAAYTFVSDIDFSGLSNGVHLFNIRFRQSNGSWSNLLSKLFVKTPVAPEGPNAISNYEYWFNDGFADRAIIETPSARIYTADDIMAVDTMSRFINEFHARFRDSKGSWTYINQQFYSLKLNLTLYLESLYNSGLDAMNKAQNESGDNFAGTVADTVTIKIRESTYPYNVVLAYNGVELHTDGSCIVQGVGLNLQAFPLINNNSYYIVIKHRNSVETWSQAVQLSSNSAYNFTDAAAKAYGNNLKPVGDTYLIFSGDVNQDGVVDTADMTPVDNDSAGYLSGYLVSDVNGDGIVDTADMTIVDNNAAGYVGSVTP